MSSTALEETGLEPIETPDVNPEAAQSSSAEPEGEKTTLDLVSEVLGAREESPTSEPGKPEVEAAPEEAAAPQEEQVDVLSEEEKKLLSEKSRNRFQTLVAQKKTLESQLSEVRPKAEQFDRIVEFAQRNNLSGEDIDNTLQIASMIKQGDMIGAYQRVLPIYQALAKAVGAELPPEYQERVRLGHLPEQDARRLAQAEAAARIHQEQLARQQQRAQEDAVRQYQAQVAQELTSAGDSWAQSKAQRDPDWPMREQLVSKLIGAEMRANGIPATAQEVYALCERIDQEVQAQFKAYGPPKREVRPVTGVGSQARLTPEPKSTLDVLTNVLSGVR